MTRYAEDSDELTGGRWVFDPATRVMRWQADAKPRFVGGRVYREEAVAK